MRIFENWYLYHLTEIYLYNLPDEHEMTAIKTIPVDIGYLSELQSNGTLLLSTKLVGRFQKKGNCPTCSALAGEAELLPIQN